MFGDMTSVLRLLLEHAETDSALLAMKAVPPEFQNKVIRKNNIQSDGEGERIIDRTLCWVLRCRVGIVAKFHPCRWWVGLDMR
jgi:hypothetical protein